MITLPQAVVGQNITGKVMATVVIEDDGAVSKVEITSSPHPALSETVTDLIYRMRFMPAKYDGECVASVAIIPEMCIRDSTFSIGNPAGCFNHAEHHAFQTVAIHVQVFHLCLEPVSYTHLINHQLFRQFNETYPLPQM